MKMVTKILKTLAFATILTTAAGCNSTTNQNPVNQGQNPKQNPPAAKNQAPQKSSQLTSPISGGLSRVTKKPFGIKVSPNNSPVQPERFSGYHTGTDFETYANEQNTDVEISAACTGKVLLKEYASGYGGVLIQSCTIDNSPVTIIYGHLRLSSISVQAADQLKAGQKFAVLGTGFSKETDGERKHLHLGIHKGTSIDIKGYVQNQSQLSGWLDAKNYLSS